MVADGVHHQWVIVKNGQWQLMAVNGGIVVDSGQWWWIVVVNGKRWSTVVGSGGW